MSDLSPWTGLVGVVVGVGLSIGIDALRTRRAAVSALRTELFRAAEQILLTQPTVTALKAFAGNVEDPAYLTMLIQQESALEPRSRPSA
jgi:hypothetical protein